MKLTIAPSGDEYTVRRGPTTLGYIVFDSGPAPWIVTNQFHTPLARFSYMSNARQYAKTYFGGAS